MTHAGAGCGLQRVGGQQLGDDLEPRVSPISTSGAPSATVLSLVWTHAQHAPGDRRAQLERRRRRAAPARSADSAARACSSSCPATWRSLDRGFELLAAPPARPGGRSRAWSAQRSPAARAPRCAAARSCACCMRDLGALDARRRALDAAPAPPRRARSARAGVRSSSIGEQHRRQRRDHRAGLDRVALAQRDARQPPGERRRRPRSDRAGASCRLRRSSVSKRRCVTRATSTSIGRGANAQASSADGRQRCRRR